MKIPLYRLGFVGALIAALLFLQAAPSLATTCAGAAPAIVWVVVKGMHSNEGLNRYTLRGKVVNLGSRAQSSNTLQFVDIYEGRTKLDSRGVPPLKPGQSYTFGYVASRSAQAGDRTTTLAFRMDVRQPKPAWHDCNAGNGITEVRF